MFGSLSCSGAQTAALFLVGMSAVLPPRSGLQSLFLQPAHSVHFGFLLFSGAGCDHVGGLGMAFTETLPTHPLPLLTSSPLG